MVSVLEKFISEFFARFQKYNANEIKFFTLKSNSNAYSMDRVQAWLKRFATEYLVVQSPHQGIHYHGVYHSTKGTTKVGKGTHLLISPLLEQKVIHTPKDYTAVQEELDQMGNMDGVPPKRKAHPVPYLPLEYGKNLIELCFEVRTVYNIIAAITGGAKAPQYKNYEVKTKARVKREHKKEKLNFHLGSVKAYLMKNLNENPNPTMYDHLRMSRKPNL